ncbi:MAG: hypothetical protein Q4F67_12745 [Propionibacteriaceae bacterium]|nr:hypothetical protein [Propionibacteriaceae bacterium]
MENDITGDRAHSKLPHPDEARNALDALTVDGARLADRVATPWWYHPALGLIVAAFTLAPALAGSASTIVVAFGIILLPVLTTTYSRRYGISIAQPVGPRSKRLLLLSLGVLILALACSLVIKLLGIAPWWVMLPALVAVIATVLLGRRYDTAFRSELGQ